MDHYIMLVHYDSGSEDINYISYVYSITGLPTFGDFDAMGLITCMHT